MNLCTNAAAVFSGLLFISSAHSQAPFEKCAAVLSNETASYHDRLKAVAEALKSADHSILTRSFAELSEPVPNPGIKPVSIEPSDGQIPPLQEIDPQDVGKPQADVPSGEMVPPRLGYFTSAPSQPEYVPDGPFYYQRGEWCDAGQIIWLRIELFKECAEKLYESDRFDAQAIDDALMSMHGDIDSDVEAYAWLKAVRHQSDQRFDTAITDMLHGEDYHYRVERRALHEAVSRFYYYRSRDIARGDSIHKDIVDALYRQRGSRFALYGADHLPPDIPSTPRGILLVIDAYKESRADKYGALQALRLARKLQRMTEEKICTASDDEMLAIRRKPEAEEAQLRLEVLQEVDQWVDKAAPDLESKAAPVAEGDQTR